MSAHMTRIGRRSERGFTYVWLMFTVAIAGVALAAAGQLWRTEAQREKEKELIFAGDQLRRAIGSYYESSPSAKRFPPSLEKLLLDDRFPVIKRHLRKIFYDPLTGKPEWGFIEEPGVGIMGVHSLSAQKPLKRANFHERYSSFEKAETYKDWKFVYSPGDPEIAAPQSQGSQPGTQPNRGSSRAAQTGAMPGAQPPGPQSPPFGGPQSFGGQPFGAQQPQPGTPAPDAQPQPASDSHSPFSDSSQLDSNNEESGFPSAMPTTSP